MTSLLFDRQRPSGLRKNYIKSIFNIYFAEASRIELLLHSESKNTESVLYNRFRYIHIYQRGIG